LNTLDRHNIPAHDSLVINSAL